MGYDVRRDRENFSQEAAKAVCPIQKNIMFELWIDLYTGAQVSVLIKIDITDYSDERVVC